MNVHPATRYKYYLLGLVTLILLFNYTDRLALGIVLEDIKLEFALSDTQLGLLSGIAFALFYSVMVIPLARWADHGNRVAIISLTEILWSTAVGLCGASRSFVQLLLIRNGVAIGDSGSFPPGLSLISDYFSRSERPHAVLIYWSAVLGDNYFCRTGSSKGAHEGPFAGLRCPAVPSPSVPLGVSAARLSRPLSTHRKWRSWGFGKARWSPTRGPDDRLEWRLMVPLSLSYDHRIVNGAEAARFVRALAETLAAPAALA